MRDQIVSPSKYSILSFLQIGSDKRLTAWRFKSSSGFKYWRVVSMSLRIKGKGFEGTEFRLGFAGWDTKR